MERRKRLLLLALVGVWFGMATEGGAIVRDSHVCSEMCEARTCEAQTECWLTQFEWENEYPSTTCEAQGYGCCGDGFCSGVEACGECEVDCGGQTCPIPQCTYHTDCDYGYVCNANHECVLSGPYVEPPGGPACGGSCETNANCCGNDLCMGEPGNPNKYCAIPATNFCGSSPSCTYHSDCQEWVNGVSCPGAKKKVYCDPGLGRCQFNYEAACPDSSNVCEGT